MKNKIWKVKRTVIEEYEVEAPNRKEAKKLHFQNPNKITVVKETFIIKKQP